MLQVGAASRTYIPYVGRGGRAETPAPLVFVHHGFTMSAQVMADLTSWKNIADREGLIIAFANGNTDSGGLSAPWNVGFPVCGVGSFVANPLQDDLGFVEAMIEDIKTLHAVDEQRIYTNGFSMGGYFANQIGCQRSGLLRGIAPHSGGASLDLCPAYEPLPVLVLHGDADPLIDYNCGVDARDRWRERNGCSDQIERTETVLGGKCEYYAGCKAAVGMCTFAGMGHGWAGAAGLGLPFDYAGGIQYANAAELIWKFWKDHP
ncbi:MAG: hypothetical protein JWN48_1847 [Myxococcaceae bacterium]|nr:hypothetical protein [Myxococcaceae bacterium]